MVRKSILIIATGVMAIWCWSFGESSTIAAGCIRHSSPGSNGFAPFYGAKSIIGNMNHSRTMASKVENGAEQATGKHFHTPASRLQTTDDDGQLIECLIGPFAAAPSCIRAKTITSTESRRHYVRTDNGNNFPSHSVNENFLDAVVVRRYRLAPVVVCQVPIATKREVTPEGDSTEGTPFLVLGSGTEFQDLGLPLAKQIRGLYTSITTVSHVSGWFLEGFTNTHRMMIGCFRSKWRASKDEGRLKEENGETELAIESLFKPLGIFNRFNTCTSKHPISFLNQSNPISSLDPTMRQQVALQRQKRSQGIRIPQIHSMFEVSDPSCLPKMVLCAKSFSAQETAHPSNDTPVLPTKHNEEYRLRDCDKTPDGRIIGGWNARTGDAPFLVSLRNLAHERRYGFGSGLFCGGSLITDQLVLSAAHCFMTSATNIGIVAGVLNRFQRTDPMQFRRAYRYLTHPNWNPKTLLADIGLLAVSTPFDLGDSPRSVATVRLPLRSPEEGWNRCSIYGWGRTKDGRRRSNPVCLQRADVEILDLVRCNRSVGLAINVPDGTFCAGRFQGGVDSCQGDSGGPLVCDDGTTLYGIVSFGWGCGRPNLPGVYTDVFRYRHWISESMDVRDRSGWTVGGGAVAPQNAFFSVLCVVSFMAWLMSHRHRAEP